MKYITLNNGVEIPQLGIGGFAQGTQEIIQALELGYRLIDTAAQYGNEEQIGVAIKNSNVARSEIFLSTKLWTEDIRQRKVREAFFKSLKRLQVEYVDMYLIHWPQEGYDEAWLEMEKLYEAGYIRAIGVSNCHKVHLDRIEQVGSIVPTVNQVESHPMFSNQTLIDSCINKGIQIEAWCPLGGTYGHLLENNSIQQLANELGKTPAQIILRWHMQRNIITFPKSAHLDRMQSNLDIFNFTLSDAEMDRINALETGRRIGPDPENFNF